MRAKMPKDAQSKCLAELRKLKAMSPMSTEATVCEKLFRLDG